MTIEEDSAGRQDTIMMEQEQEEMNFEEHDNGGDEMLEDTFISEQAAEEDEEEEREEFDEGGDDDDEADEQEENIEEQEENEPEENNEEENDEDDNTQLQDEARTESKDNETTSNLPESNKPNSSVKPKSSSTSSGSVKFPLSRVKKIMKVDNSVHNIGSEALFLVTKAAELFATQMITDCHRLKVQNQPVKKGSSSKGSAGAGTLTYNDVARLFRSGEEDDIYGSMLADTRLDLVVPVKVPVRTALAERTSKYNNNKTGADSKKKESSATGNSFDMLAFAGGKRESEDSNGVEENVEGEENENLEDDTVLEGTLADDTILEDTVADDTVLQDTVVMADS